MTRKKTASFIVNHSENQEAQDERAFKIKSQARLAFNQRVDEATAQSLREAVAKGAMPPLVLMVDDCRAAYDRMSAKGVEFTQEPVRRFGTVDAGFRDPSGNGWKMIEAKGGSR